MGNGAIIVLSGSNTGASSSSSIHCTLGLAFMAAFMTTCPLDYTFLMISPADDFCGSAYQTFHQEIALAPPYAFRLISLLAEG